MSMGLIVRKNSSGSRGFVTSARTPYAWLCEAEISREVAMIIGRTSTGIPAIASRTSATRFRSTSTNSGAAIVSHRSAADVSMSPTPVRSSRRSNRSAARRNSSSSRAFRLGHRTRDRALGHLGDDDVLRARDDAPSGALYFGRTTSCGRARRTGRYRQKRRTVARSRSRSTGFLITSTSINFDDAPAADTTTVGMTRYFGCSICLRLNSQPSISGIMRSKRISDGTESRPSRYSSAAKPFFAVSATKPSISRSGSPPGVHDSVSFRDRWVKAPDDWAQGPIGSVLALHDGAARRCRSLPLSP